MLRRPLAIATSPATIDLGMDGDRQRPLQRLVDIFEGEDGRHCKTMQAIIAREIIGDPTRLLEPFETIAYKFCEIQYGDLGTGPNLFTLSNKMEERHIFRYYRGHAQSCVQDADIV